MSILDREYMQSEQIDPAVALGIAPKPLPDIINVADMLDNLPSPPSQIIDGILHKGCRMVLGGTSKSNKSWCLLDLALSVASGQPWWGRATTKMPVVFLNFELQPWSVAKRLNDICAKRPECRGFGRTLHLWNLRGHNADLTILRPKLEEVLAQHQFGLLILDPAYKLLGNREENSNGDIADLMNELERLAQASGAAVVLSHHYAKGDSTSKEAGDRMSGAGAWVRDPDSIMVLTPHEEEDHFTVSTILRNLPKLPEFVVGWEFPVMNVKAGMNPDALRRPQSKLKSCTDEEFRKAVGSTPLTYGQTITKVMDKLKMAESTAQKYLQRLVEAGVVKKGNDRYWA